MASWRQAGRAQGAGEEETLPSRLSERCSGQSWAVFRGLRDPPPPRAAEGGGAVQGEVLPAALPGICPVWSQVLWALCVAGLWLGLLSLKSCCRDSCQPAAVHVRGLWRFLARQLPPGPLM